ncbi:MAG: NAD(P)-dependent oxidoreductase [Opitutae bacterium]|nr:NAD(P)-dependent oxidoreductase [Opitutae bacterium]MBT6851541.1 NAD(P)-dependent oxidoreductase [Opitutae bacterium]MBT7741098.1 NAD(P)-dependent oxidoreductase [Opitutae bacterium]MBT7923059.1 NAD(P)-dependent oxidoreductase [Opitutae bacterium]
MSKSIGWIGTGVMGYPMAGHLLSAGYDVRIYNRTKDKAIPLIQQGARWCESAGDASEGADFVFSIVGFPQDVEEIFFGERGILSTAKNGSVVVDMTTSEPSLAERIYETAKEKEVSSLDAPVSGGDLGARNATLSMMVGGDEESFRQTKPLLEVMGENISWFGPAGSGQRVKMSNQILIATTMIGTVESLLYAVRSGLKPNAVIDLIGSGAAGCWSINNLGRRIVKGDYAPGFFIKHFVKDMSIALQDAERLGLKLPGLSLAKEFYDQAVEAGQGNEGTQALYKVLESMSSAKT